MNNEKDKAKCSYNTTLFLTDSANISEPANPIIIPRNIKLRENIGYSAESGVITINDAGEYFLNFCISAANSVNYSSIITISFNQITPSNTIIAISSSATKVKPKVCCSLTGCAIFTATTGSTYAFFNNSKSTIAISPNNLAETNITIFRIN